MFVPVAEAGRPVGRAAEITLPPAELAITATCRDEAAAAAAGAAAASDAAAGTLIMAMRHRTRPIFGVQFHPESILTEHGKAMIRNFLAMKGA